MLINRRLSFMARWTVLPYLEFEQGRSQEQPHFSMDLSRVFDKKVGILIKKESESLIFTGLKIPRDY